MGDFNEILSQVEKVGGCLKPEGQMRRFSEVVDLNGLIDVGFVGSLFTWSNNHRGDSFTKEWLDKVLINSMWLEGGFKVRVQGLVAHCSDHKHLLVSFINKGTLGGKLGVSNLRLHG